MKLLPCLILTSALLFNPTAHANGSTTASKGSEQIASGSITVLAGGASIVQEVAASSGNLVVGSIEVAGEVVVLTLEATTESAASVVIHLSAATELAANLAIGTAITVSAVTASTAIGTSTIIGHLLVHAGEVLLFIPHHELAIGLHSHEM